MDGTTESTDETETTTDETTEQTSSSGTETAGDNDGEFNPAEYEASFGLPAGSLKDVTDADSALKVIREHTDKLLIAGLSAGGAADLPTAEEKPAPKPKADDKKPVASGNAEIDALRAELAEVKGTIANQTKAQQQSQLQELDRRILTEIDSWKSPKYGVGTTRNYKQVKATRALREILLTHVAGYQATGQPIPLVETALRQVRVHDDEDYKPVVKKKDGALGTPGRSGKSGGDTTPANIHQALMQNQT